MIFGNKKKPNSFGIDVGTKSIKIVEVSQKKEGIVLENYAELNLDFACRDFFRSFDKNNLNPDIDNISTALRMVIAEAEIKNKIATFSLPDFATFYSSFEMPPMSKKEIDDAVGFEARKYIPLPLSEVVLDWQLIDQGGEIDKEAKTEVLVMAVPKIVIGQYKEIAEKAGIVLDSLEAEAMALKRSLLFREENSNACLVEIGYQSTNVSVISNGFMKMSFSFDLAGKDLTNIIAERFDVDAHEAEKAKRKYGIVESEELSLKEILEPTLNNIVIKIKKIIKEIESEQGIPVERIILSGGTSLMPGLLDYFITFFNGVSVELGKPFEKIGYNKSLEGKMEEINANYAIALGEALRNFEQ
jgi:type IV pilus assembly protein PilM